MSFFVWLIKTLLTSSAGCYTPKPVHRGPEEGTDSPPSEAQREAHTQLLSRITDGQPHLGLQGPDYVTGSNLPSHSDVQISCFTGVRIQVRLAFLYVYTVSVENCVHFLGNYFNFEILIPTEPPCRWKKALVILDLMVLPSMWPF